MRLTDISGGGAGSAKGGADIELRPEGGQATLLVYRARAGVSGKLAQLGSRLIMSTPLDCKRVLHNFNKRVSGEEAVDALDEP
jgi:carbon monoxide dehydrogenase subunit G